MDNIVYHQRECTSIYHSLSYTLKFQKTLACLSEVVWVSLYKTFADNWWEHKYKRGRKLKVFTQNIQKRYNGDEKFNIFFV